MSTPSDLQKQRGPPVIQLKKLEKPQFLSEEIQDPPSPNMPFCYHTLGPKYGKKFGVKIYHYSDPNEMITNMADFFYKHANAMEFGEE